MTKPYNPYDGIEDDDDPTVPYLGKTRIASDPTHSGPKPPRAKNISPPDLSDVYKTRHIADSGLVWSHPTSQKARCHVCLEMSKTELPID